MHHYRGRVLAGLLLGLVLTLQGHTAPLTEAQYQQLHTDVTVTHAAEFQALVDAADDAGIAAAYNLAAAPVFWVWRTSLSEKEIYEATSPDATQWSWVTYKQQTVQDRDSWSRMMAPGAVNPSLQQTRDGWVAIFGGQGAAQAQVNFLLALARRQALRNEALFANTSGGAGTPAAPALLTYAGTLRPIDLAHALRGVPLP